MKLSWLPVSYFPQLICGEMQLESWLDQAVSLGLDAVDASIIFFRDSGKMDPEKFRMETEKRGIEVAVMNTYSDFTNPDKQKREMEIKQFESDVRLAAQIGAKMVRVTAGQSHPELGKETAIKYAVENLTRAADISQRIGVLAVYENHSKPGVWDYADFSHPAEIFIEIFQKLKDAPLGILFDTANADARGDNAMMILEKVIGRVNCVHIADTAVRGKLQPTVIGTGVVDFDNIFGSLKEYGYDGWLSIEEASGKEKDGVIEAVKFIRDKWSK
ncbi:MAG: sugar phosphate isomerase/epimerase [candidate division Zixibacteria bacterium]|nr:sugar phosphate isomerase/epimerase [candidate division Zixibacteria bacterium]